MKDPLYEHSLHSIVLFIALLDIYKMYWIWKLKSSLKYEERTTLRISFFFSDLMPKLSKRKLVPGKGGIYHTRFLEQRQIDKVKMSSYLKCGVLRVLVVQNNKEMD